jgi:outer membrane protein
MNFVRKGVFVLASSVLCSASFMAAAQQAGELNQVRLGVDYSRFSSGNDNASGIFTTDSARIKNQSNLTLGYQRFVDPNLAIGAEYGIRRSSDVEIGGARIGSIKGEKFGLNVDYYFGNSGETIRPYAGAGVVYRHFSDGGLNADGQTVLGADTQLDGKSTTGLAARVGADFKIADNAHAYAGASWEPFTKGDLKLASAALGDNRVDLRTRPLSIGAGVGFSF